MTTRFMRLALWGWTCALAPFATSAWADTGGTAAERSAQSPPAAVAEEAATVTVTVEDVDKRNRTMTVRTPDGDRVVIDVPPDTKNFDSRRSRCRIRRCRRKRSRFAPATRFT